MTVAATKTSLKIKSVFMLLQSLLRLIITSCSFRQMPGWWGCKIAC